MIKTDKSENFESLELKNESWPTNLAKSIVSNFYGFTSFNDKNVDAMYECYIVILSVRIDTNYWEYYCNQ